MPHEYDKQIIFIDIETVPCVSDYAQLSERIQKQWQRKASFLRKREEETDGELFWQRSSVYAEFAKVIVIGMGLYVATPDAGVGLRVKSVSGEDEGAVLRQFAEILNKMGERAVLCAHNGKEFDFPFLCRRFLVNGIALPAALQLSGKKPWEIKHIDTMEMWKFGDHKNYTALDLLAALFDIPTSKQELDGSMVADAYYKQQDLPAVARYCEKDVVVLAQVYRRLKEQPPIEHIVFA